MPVSTLLYNMTVGGDTDTTAEDITISKVVGRTYHVLTFTSRRPYSLETPITISVNGVSIFTGIIISMDKQTKSTYIYECRSASARLSAPFISDRVYMIEDADSSAALFGTWSNETGVPITNGMIDIDFGTKYVRNGTIGDNIISIASITKADVWLDENDVIQIQPKKHIDSTTNPIIKPTEILENIPQSNSVGEKLVNRIYVQTVDYEEKCYIEVQPNNGAGFMRISSSSMRKPTVTSGAIGASVTTKEFVETGELNDDIEIITIGSMASINSLKLNGVQVSYDRVVENTILLNGEMSGLYEVVYSSYGYSIQAVRVGTSWSFQSSCGGGWWAYQEVGQLSPADSTNVVDDNMQKRIEIVGGRVCYLFYTNVLVYSNNDDYDIHLHWDNTSTYMAIDCTHEEHTVTETITVPDVAQRNGQYRIGKLQYDIERLLYAIDMRTNKHIYVEHDYEHGYKDNEVGVSSDYTDTAIQVTYTVKVCRYIVSRTNHYQGNHAPKRLLVTDAHTGNLLAVYSVSCSSDDYVKALGCDAPIDFASTLGMNASELAGRSAEVVGLYNTHIHIDMSGHGSMVGINLDTGRYTLLIRDQYGDSDKDIKLTLIVNGGGTE